MSVKSIRDSWYEFTPSAHLWAAQMINLEYPYMREGEFFSSSEHLQTFLGVAAAILKFATTYIPKRSPERRPIVRREEAWLIPASVTPLVLSSKAPFPNGLSAVTRHYRATSAKKPSKR